MSQAKPPYIDPARTWVTSDSHWGHENIIGFCRRPADHEKIMIEEWQKAVPHNGTVLHLGDVCYKGNGMFKHVIAKQLTGERKLLCKGNHDSQRPSFYRDCGFKLIKPFEMLYDPDPARKNLSARWIVSFSHYPWKQENKTPFKDGNARKRIHLHGHIHNNGYNGVNAPYSPFAAGQINVSVEQTHYRPVNLQELLYVYINGAYQEEDYDKKAKEAD